MTTNFDDILSKGKKAANIDDPRAVWKAYVTNIMFELHYLNEMYKDVSTHHIAVEQQSCYSCGEATFILSVRDWDDRSKALKFHKGNWKSTDIDKYICEKCKA